MCIRTVCTLNHRSATGEPNDRTCLIIITPIIIGLCPGGTLGRAHFFWSIFGILWLPFVFQIYITIANYRNYRRLSTVKKYLNYLHLFYLSHKSIKPFFASTLWSSQRIKDPFQLCFAGLFYIRIFRVGPRHTAIGMHWALDIYIVLSMYGHKSKACVKPE